MIRKTRSGYKVVSHSGRNLSKSNLSHAAAVKRLRQIEHFKRKGKR